MLKCTILYVTTLERQYKNTNLKVDKEGFNSGTNYMCNVPIIHNFPPKLQL